MKRKLQRAKSPSPCNSNVSIAPPPLPDVSNLVLWRKPLLTSYYAFLETRILLKDFWKYAASFVTRKRLVLLSTILAIVFFLNQTPGSHQMIFTFLRKYLLWSLYWLGLGFLSSVGFGFGLHTFVLYLAPHIISVTLAAYECQSVDFMEPPYPERIVCPSESGVVTPWVIMYKVIWECFMWGAGTAIGELPPYFVARTYRLSGKVDEEEAELQALRLRNPRDLTLTDKTKIFIQDLVNKIGFFGILLCASVPNPLFDLAGVTCGHFLIPFWTFFGATLIGKAIIKMSIQSMFVILVFSENHFRTIMNFLKSIPRIGSHVGPAVEGFIAQQRHKLRHPEEKEGLLPSLFNIILSTILVCFVISIINSLAQRYKTNQNVKERCESQK